MSTGRRRRITTEDVGKVTVVEFVDPRILDEQNIELIGRQLFDLVDEDEKANLLLDFGKVEYLSTAFFGKLINLSKKVKGRNGRLRLSSVKPEIYETFEITGLNKAFPIYDDREKGLEAFA
jgi:anti-sigma B factor antagonist